MIWAIFIAVIFSAFLALEIYQRAHGKPTLSRAILDLQARFPLYSFIAGMVIGGLAVHFFAHNPSCAP